MIFNFSTVIFFSNTRLAYPLASSPASGSNSVGPRGGLVFPFPIRPSPGELQSKVRSLPHAGMPGSCRTNETVHHAVW